MSRRAVDTAVPRPVHASMSETDPPVPKPLSDAAKRALAEAAARRADQEAREADLAARRELDGRGGMDPVRYGDWEAKGIASDF